MSYEADLKREYLFVRELFHFASFQIHNKDDFLHYRRTLFLRYCWEHISQEKLYDANKVV